MRSAVRILALLTVVAIATAPTTASAVGMHNLKASIQSIAQFPLDIVWHVILPPEDFVDEFPAGQVTGRLVGVFSGPTLALYRATMGVSDLVFFPFWVLPVMSPEPRYEWFEDVEYE